MKKIIDIITLNKLDKILCNSNIVNNTIESICQETSIKPVFFNPLAYNLPENYLYIANSIK